MLNNGFRVSDHELLGVNTSIVLIDARHLLAHAMSREILAV